MTDQKSDQPDQEDENVVDFEEASSQVRRIIQLEQKDRQDAAQQVNQINQKQLKLGALLREFRRQEQELLDEIEELQDTFTNLLEKLRYKYDAPEEEYIFNIPGNGQGPKFAHKSLVENPSAAQTPPMDPTGGHTQPQTGEPETSDDAD